MPGAKFNRHVENLVANLRGLPENPSRARLRESRDIAGLVEQILHKHRIGMATPEDAVREAWPEIVGETIARLCHPLRIDRERTLIVGASNPVVRQELEFHKAGVLARIRAIPACAHITSVSFRAG
jgi:hypothetical protein